MSIDCSVEYCLPIRSETLPSMWNLKNQMKKQKRLKYKKELMIAIRVEDGKMGKTGEGD